MSVWRLIVKEILHRKLSFALAVMSVTVAVGVLVANAFLLRAHDVRTEQILADKHRLADERLAKMEDDYRKYMKELGFNLLILPKAQSLAEFWQSGFASHTMSESNVRKLSDSSTESMRHLLPLVQQRVLWPEQRRKIILIGTRGEVPIKYRRPKEPMLLAVPQGKAVVGYELASDLALKAGDTISLLGGKFSISRVLQRRGSAQDATIWVSLLAAQKLLKMEGRINAIEALKCHCAGVGMDALRREVAAVLPDTKVVIRENKVTLRAKARSRAKKEHETAIAEELSHRVEMRRTRQAFGDVLVPLVIVASGLWIAVLTLNNVRRRRVEISVLRAMGVRSRRVLFVFMAKAILTGLIGSILGYAGGFAAAFAAESAGGLFDPALFAQVVIAALTLCILASCLPAMLAAQQDPAIVLSEE